MKERKIVKGFAMLWILSWIFINCVIAFIYIQTNLKINLYSPNLVTFSLCVMIIVGYFLLLFKNRWGLYYVFSGNLLCFFLGMSSLTIINTFGLMAAVITYFITRKQVTYPYIFERKQGTKRKSPVFIFVSIICLFILGIAYTHYESVIDYENAVQAMERLKEERIEFVNKLKADPNFEVIYDDGEGNFSYTTAQDSKKSKEEIQEIIDGYSGEQPK